MKECKGDLRRVRLKSVRVEEKELDDGMKESCGRRESQAALCILRGIFN